MDWISERGLAAMLLESVNLCSQKTIAKLIGVSPQYINDVVHGRREPSQKIATYFGLTRCVIFVESPEAPTEVEDGKEG